jgi:CHRD domain-containing protein
VRRFIAVGVVIAAIVPALALGSTAKTVKLEAKLAGKNEVPKAAGATGEAFIQITGTKVCWQFKELKGVAGALASHIHKAAVGKAGPIVVPLGGAFKMTGCTTAPSTTIASAIAANPKAFYVNVHTPKFPAGAARGQLEVQTGSS